jgi:DNA-binding response OmpR family regulator
MQKEIICMLIDDDSDDHEFFELALQELDIPVTCITANNGAEGLHRLSDESFVPDYIFLDLNMPLMNGKQCLAEIRKIDRLAVVPVIIYSTSHEHKDMVETRMLRADSYLVKPTQISVLKQRLEELFKAQ